MNRIKIRWLLTAFFCFALSACTSRAWYEGMQENQRQECYKCRSHEEIQECLDNVNRGTYDVYQKEQRTL